MNLPPNCKLVQFMGTVQVVEKVSDYRTRIVCEVPKPYDPQSDQWWQDYIDQAIAKSSEGRQ